jgi:hypothetical protein
MSTATISAIAYCDECLDEIDLIPGMIAADGNDWFLVQGGATWHPSEETMAVLGRYTTVRPDSPSGSPDLNRIENLCGTSGSSNRGEILLNR